MSSIYTMDISIRTLEPVVISSRTNDTVLTTSADAISGSILRGALAGMLIRKKGLGEEAHKDESFHRLFLEDNISYVDALPVLDEGRSIVAPLSLQREKSGVGVQDVMFAKELKLNYKRISGHVVVEGQSLIPVSVAKGISLHMSRNEAHERVSGKSEDGHIYSYEAINAGQDFCGLAVGDRESLQQLNSELGLDRTQLVYLGRSKFSQYGKCQLQAGDIKAVDAAKVAKAADPQGVLTLRLDTPYLPDWDRVDAVEALQEIVSKLNELSGSHGFQLLEDRLVTKQEPVGNFVNSWRMKRSDEMALAAGTVFQLACQLDDAGRLPEQAASALQQVMYGRYARRSSEGFGQLRLWQEQQLQAAEVGLSVKAKKPALSDNVKQVVRNILLTRMKKEIRQMAAADVASKAKKLSGKKHIFSRLEKELGDRSNLANKKTEFERTIRSVIKSKSAADNHLSRIVFSGDSLMEILRGEKPSPYMHNFDWQELLGEGITAIAQDVDFQLPAGDSGELYYEYWLWFFRHARKQGGEA